MNEKENRVVSTSAVLTMHFDERKDIIFVPPERWLEMGGAVYIKLASWEMEWLKQNGHLKR